MIINKGFKLKFETKKYFYSIKKNYTVLYSIKKNYTVFYSIKKNYSIKKING